MAPSSEAAAGRLEQTPIHAALYRRPLYFGVPRDFLFMEAGALALVVVLGWPSWKLIVPVALVLCGLHPRLARVSRNDPRRLDLFLRALNFPEILVRTPAVRSRRVRHWTALPRR
ncbi:MAG TPA: VirB3 family type IV secretion system protein [Longimicrobium sp.]|nr:VirB3 family type IV secretion system protein [Longimicrobium sp.]